MSSFFSEKYKALTPYTPGEQPKERRFIKLNTNESPFPPSKKAQEYAAKAAESLQLYSDPTCAKLTAKVAEVLGVEPDEVLLTNNHLAHLVAQSIHKETLTLDALIQLFDIYNITHIS